MSEWDPIRDIEASKRRINALLGAGHREPIIMSARDAEELYRQIRAVQEERDQLRERLEATHRLLAASNEREQKLIQLLDELRRAYLAEDPPRPMCRPDPKGGPV